MVRSMGKARRALTAAAAALLLAGLAGCGNFGGGSEMNFPERRKGETSPTWTNEGPRETVFGPGGLSIFGGDKKKADEGGGGIGVNAFLWRASLDTVAFMPISSADPFGGVILTDWFAPPETPDERFKVTVFIMDRALRADGVRVSVFRQVRDRAGNWVDAPVDARAGGDVEDAILTRARQLRIGGGGVAQQ